MIMESTPQEAAEGQAIVQVLAFVLERIVSANSHLAESQKEVTKFHALSAPPIGILQYLERIHKYAYCSKECFVLALIYIDRLIQRNNFLLTTLNVHRVVITAVLLAAKFFDDAYYNNRSYAKVGGVEVREMNALECEFLFMIDFSLRVEPEEFDKYRDELISHNSVMELERVENYSHQVQAMGSTQCQHQRIVTSAPQASMLSNHSPTDLDPPPAACHQVHAPEASHYPIQVLHQNMMEASQQAQVTQQQGQVGQLQQQQRTTAAPLELVFPFPTLPRRVSSQEHTPMLDPIELDDLVSYHDDADATTAASTAAVVPQDVSAHQYNFRQDVSSAQHVNHAPVQQHAYSHPAPQQVQAYSQAELMDSLYCGDFATPAAARAQHANYFTNNVTTPGITPSPPLQPPLHVHHEAHQLPTRCGSSHVNFADDITHDLGIFLNGDRGVR